MTLSSFLFTPILNQSPQSLTTDHCSSGRSGLRPSLVQGLRPRNAPLQKHASPTVRRNSSGASHPSWRRPTNIMPVGAPLVGALPRGPDSVDETSTLFLWPCTGRITKHTIPINNGPGHQPPSTAVRQSSGVSTSASHSPGVSIALTSPACRRSSIPPPRSP